MRKGVKIGIGVGIVAVAAIGMGSALLGRKERGIEVQTAVVARKDLVAHVLANGKLQPRSKVDMADGDDIARNTRRRPFVDGRSKKRGFGPEEGPEDRIGADAVGEGQEEEEPKAKKTAKDEEEEEEKRPEREDALQRGQGPPQRRRYDRPRGERGVEREDREREAGAVEDRYERQEGERPEREIAHGPAFGPVPDPVANP